MGSLRERLRDLLPGPLRERYHRHALQRDFGIDPETGLRRARPIDTSLPQGINIVGYWDSASGIGESARSLKRAAKAVGLAVSRIEVPSPGRSRTVPAAPYDVTLYHVNADGAAGAVEELGPAVHAGRGNIAYWYWETEFLPARWRDRFAYFDEIWVATEFCRRAIERLSPVPVRVVPPAVVVESPPIVRAVYGVAESPVFFLTIADPTNGIERKNPAGTIRAFARAFPEPGEATLLALCRGAGAIRGLPEELRRTAQGAAVVLVERTLRRKEVEGLLAACDGYISLHRAEGFGFPIAEAMSLGKPVVATNWSGNHDYLDESTGYPVAWRPWVLPRDTGPYEAGTRWAEPDEEQAAEALRSIVRNRVEASRRGAAARRRIREVYAPAVTGRRIAEALDYLRKRLRSGP